MTSIEMQNHLLRIILDDKEVRKHFEVVDANEQIELMKVFSQNVQAVGRRLAINL